MKMYWSTHRHRTKLLSLLCALAIFASLIPAALAAPADGTQKTALETALEKAVVQDAVTPAGVQLNLFDYWVSSEAAADTDTPYSAVNATGINKDHYLKFNNSGPVSNGDDNINQWTGSSSPKSGIVQDRLSGGYPVLTSGKAYGANWTMDTTTEQSLAYLFDKSDESGTYGNITSYKKTFWDVAGLLRVGKDGYYYYNANQNNVDEKKYESANYAYFNKETKAFTLYDKWAVTSNGNSGIKGQFFPFTDPKAVFTLNDGALTQSSTKSTNPSVSHYFGMTMISRFIQRYDGKTAQTDGEDMTFEFSGDDDVWIFIDGVLVADLGGIHDQATTTINFATGDITINGEPAKTLKEKMSKYYGEDSYWAKGKNTFANDTYHTLKLFYLERGGYDSNLAMKFNLAYVPETGGVKIDQDGKLLSNVTFALYPARREPKGDGTYKYTKTSDEPIGFDTTDEKGQFVLSNADDIAVSLNDLHKRDIKYLILEEQNKNRDGYRHDESIDLVLENKDVQAILLNDENHRWTTGTYAAAKETISTGPNITMPATKDKPDPETANLDENKGLLFGVIMRRMNNVGVSVPKSGVDEWGVVTGSNLSGWQVTGRASSTNGYIGAALRAIQTPGNEKNCVIFEPAANGAWMAEFNHCPGDLRNYYYWEGGENTAYAVAFFYTTAKNIAEAAVANTRWVDGTGFERQFAATIYIPNVQHHLYVKKVDDSAAQKPLSGAVFDLYTAESLTVTDGAYEINPNAVPYDTVTTGDDGLAAFPSKEKKLLAAGNYYLVERTAPAGHAVNPTPVPVIVDDTHGVIADAGTEEDGISVNVSEGTLVPTMTPFATNDAIDHSLTDVTTTRMDAPSGSWNPNLASTTEQVKLTLDMEKFARDGSMSYTSHSDRDCWSTETGWLWFHIAQTPFDASAAPLKTNLSSYDLTRLFSGKTTVVVTDTRVGSLEIRKTVTDLTRKATGLPTSYALEIALNGSAYNGEVSYTSKVGDAAAQTGKLQFTGGKTTYDIQPGETLTLLDLPLGTTWSVKETAELSAENWRTTVNGQTGKEASGEIKEAGQHDTVAIVNSYDKYNTYTGTLTGFRVSKTYATSDIYDGSVTFKLEATGAAPLPVQTEISLTKAQIDEGEFASFDNLTFTSTGTYTYTIREVPATVTSGQMNYDDAVYTITVTVTEGSRRLDASVKSFTVTRNQQTTTLLTPTLLTPDIPLCTFVNSYTPAPTTGTLTVTKEVETAPNSTAPDADQTFPIQITLKNADNTTYTGKIGNLTPDEPGKATWKAKNGESLTLTLPIGTKWDVTELTDNLPNPTRWSTTVSASTGATVLDLVASGTISTTGSAVNITNTYDYAATPTKAEATIKVSKQYGAQTYGEPVQFTITGIDGTATPNPSSLSITGANSNQFKLTFNTAGMYTYTVSEVNGGVKDMTYAETVYTVTFNVARGTGSDRNKLVATPTYTVIEKPGDVSKLYPYTDATGLLFTNTYNPGSSEEQDKGSLSIKKTLVKPDNVTTGLPENYEIKITLTKEDHTAYTDSVSYTSDAAQHDTLTFTGGEATYRIQAGETLTLSDLPVGTQWTVTETAQLDSKYWRTAYKVNGQDATTVSDEISAANETDAVIITNTYDPNGGEIVPGDTGSLTIYKTVGDGIDMRLSFDFSILLTYQNQTTETRMLTVPANGSVTISDLPVGTLYAVTETTTGYTVTATNATGSIPVGGTTAAFHNALTGGGDVPGPGPGPGPNPGGNDGGTPALNRRDHYAYIIGYPDGNVRPQGNITRAEVATIFFRLLRDPVRTQYWSQTNSYSDVAGDKWYNNAISTLSNMGIICGYPDGTFRPDAPITRAELTKIAASFFADPRVAREYDGRFSDVKGSEWYIAYLMKAIEEALIYGYPDGTFGPNRPITRAETCAIVNRTLGRKPDKDHLLPELVMITWPDNLRPLAWYYAHMQEATNSHDYSCLWQNVEQMENWTGKLRERDWAALERTWSHAHSAPGGEVMQ